MTNADRTCESTAVRPDAAAHDWFFANAAELFAILSGEGELLAVNPAWEAATGWTGAELTGRNLWDLIHPGDRPPRDVCDRRLRVRLATRVDDWVWMEGRLSRRPDGGLVAAFRDVTEARWRANELDRIRAVQARLQEAARVRLWRFDLAAKRLEWSTEWATMRSGAGAELRTADDFMAACHPDDLPAINAAMRQVIAMPGQVASYDHRLRAPDGSWTWNRVNIWSEDGPAGQPIVHGISQDVTALAEARREAETQAQRLRIALGAARGAVIEIDYGARQVWVSQEFHELVGRGLSYAEATSVWPFVHPDDVPRVRETLVAWREHGAAEPLDARIVRPDGTVFWGSLCIEIQQEAHGAKRRAVGLLLDIDERKRQELALIAAEKAAQLAAEAKSQFIANMSHEIRTPMNGVLGVLHLLKSEKFEPPVEALVDEALSCGRMLQALLDDVVDFAKIEAGRLELAPEATDPGAVVRGVVKMLRPLADDKGLTLQVHCEDLPKWVLTDPVRLRQCLYNLVGNAVKFTAEGSVTVRARTLGSGAGLRLAFEVQDTGIGIAPDVQARLFRRFQQADASTTRRFGGSGLGLAITRRVVELMGGEVGVRSAEGEGSTFWFEIAAPQAEAADAVEAPAEGVLEGLRVLVVEDNATNRMIATKMLEGLGASVETAQDGEHGVSAASRGFDLILMDIQMPGIDGVEATRRIRASGGPAASTPVVALTANVMTHQRAAYLAAGMDGCVAKPISPGALLAEIGRLAAAMPEEVAAATA